MNDRELLEMAAKAAGIKPAFFSSAGDLCHRVQDGLDSCFVSSWNPLKYDSDALKLALKLGICIQFIPECDTVQVYQERSTTGETFNVHVAGLGDIETRRVITQAAAEIGRSMP